MGPSSESIIAGDLVFEYPGRPHLLDLQEHAFEMAMRRIQKVRQGRNIEIGRVLVGFNGSVESFPESRSLPSGSEKVALADLSRELTSHLRSIAARFEVPLHLIECLYRPELSRQIGSDHDAGVGVDVTALLFKNAVDFQSGTVPATVRAYFQKDPVASTRVTRDHLVEAAIHAQTQLGVSSQIIIYFYDKLPMGNILEAITLVEAGRGEDLK